MRGVLINGYFISEDELAPVRQFIQDSAIQEFEELASEDWAWTTDKLVHWVNKEGLRPSPDGRGHHVDPFVWNFLESLHEKRWGKKP